MFTTGISPNTQAVLATLAGVDFVKDYYLAGGTATALYYGHRVSYDLDFFSPQPLASHRITEILQDIGKLQVDQEEEGTWLGQLDRVKLSFFVHPYPEVGKEEAWNGIRVASKLDIACMKLEAIGSRGIKRDFVDMYYLCQDTGLGVVFEAARRKYAKADMSEMHFLRSLTYFVEAESVTTGEPTMIHKLDWEKIKRYFETEVKHLAKDWDLV